MKNIIITGGELFNKGAQAMVFITVDEMKKRFPDHHIYVLSEMDNKRPEEEKMQYTFDFLGWYPESFAKAQNSFLVRFACLFKHHKEFKKCESIYRNTDLMIDISGYALGSIWSNNCNKLYLNNLRFAKEYNIPVYLMPQSFGPFDFEEQKRNDIAEDIRELLPYCSAICAREKEGFEELRLKYNLNNIFLKSDLVLNNKSIDYSNIYRSAPKILLPEIHENSVAVIPNKQLEKVKANLSLKHVYNHLIKNVLKNGYHIYLISHSSGDHSLNKEIKEGFADENRVHLIDKELSSVEFNEMLSSFDFLIASRYHAIVHAYKKVVPCLVLGWATKYRELTSLFHQEQYYFDCREEISEEAINNALKTLIQNRKTETTKIGKELNEIQKENIFDIIGKEKSL